MVFVDSQVRRSTSLQMGSLSFTPNEVSSMNVNSARDYFVFV